MVKKGVFHSGLFFSTKYLCSFISMFDLEGKSFLELGAGSGLISLVAARKGALVMASDINPAAVQNIKLNAESNSLIVNALYSDLYDSIHALHEFDYTIINPPYYPLDPSDASEMAWYCGKGFEYFQKLFTQLKSRVNHGKYFMVLSEDCAIEKIISIAENEGLQMKMVEQKRIFFELNVIFQITPIAQIYYGSI